MAYSAMHGITVTVQGIEETPLMSPRTRYCNTHTHTHAHTCAQPPVLKINQMCTPDMWLCSLASSLTGLAFIRGRTLTSGIAFAIVACASLGSGSIQPQRGLPWRATRSRRLVRFPLKSTTGQTFSGFLHYYYYFLHLIIVLSLSNYISLFKVISSVLFCSASREQNRISCTHLCVT